MEEKSFGDIFALTPHKYPWGVKIFALAMIAVVVYSLYLLPTYFTASRKLRQAEAIYKDLNNFGNYNEAIKLYLQVIKAVPDSKAAKIGVAEAIFSSRVSIDDKKVGLLFIEDIEFNKSSWERITKVMPTEFQQYFQDIKK